MEQYIKIKRFGYRYSISNYGNVITHIGKERKLKPCKNTCGYLFVRLCYDNKIKNELVHRLVAEYFIENNFNLSVVDHIDENKQNNNYNNLQWMSSKENTRKSQSKKILQKTLNGELIKIWGGFGHIQEELGLHKSNIQKCCAGIKYKTAYGYKWEYDNYNCNLQN
jgi:hypothetical protein